MDSRLPLWTLGFSLLFALLLYFYPLRGDIGQWRPQLVLLVVIYWLFALPHQLGVGFAWLAGIVLDILTAGTLGQHALAMACCAYLLCLAGQRLHHFSVWHQMVVMFILSVLYQLVIIFVNLLAGNGADALFMFYPVVTTTLLWPLVAGLLSRLHRPL